MSPHYQRSQADVYGQIYPHSSQSKSTAYTASLTSPPKRPYKYTQQKTKKIIIIKKLKKKKKKMSSMSRVWASKSSSLVFLMPTLSSFASTQLRFKSVTVTAQTPSPSPSPNSDYRMATEASPSPSPVTGGDDSSSSSSASSAIDFLSLCHRLKVNHKQEKKSFYLFIFRSVWMPRKFVGKKTMTFVIFFFSWKDDEESGVGEERGEESRVDCGSYVPNGTHGSHCFGYSWNRS